MDKSYDCVFDKAIDCLNECYLKIIDDELVLSSQEEKAKENLIELLREILEYADSTR